MLVAGERVTVQVYNIRGELIDMHPVKVSPLGEADLWTGILKSGKRAADGVYLVNYLDINERVLSVDKQVF